MIAPEQIIMDDDSDMPKPEAKVYKKYLNYKDYFYAEVEVCYVLRVRDKELAAGCAADHYWNTVRCGSSSLMENQMKVLVPLELVTIQFNAAVSNYD